MKIKQQTLKGFECEIGEIEAFKTYYTKNAPLMQGHLLILKGSVSAEVKAFLDEKNAIYVDANEKTLLTRKKRNTAVLELREVEVQKSPEESSAKGSSQIYHRTIRSGEAICIDENLVFTSRINSGALIESSCSIQIFGIIDGLVRSDGEYLLLKNIGKGTVIFHGEELEKSQFNGQLKLVEYKNAQIVIKEV
ncbi:MAG: hypothetical protein COA44_09815 [Arcobacter sp.]|nr:MAG: hypothetical protein COA44_09815 [Arcobacter sp.]